MTRALMDAGVVPDAVGYVNAHGTGTPENDKMEWVGISAVFGERSGSLPISSNKSMIGHTLTAAGTIEAIFTLYTMRYGLLPPTINYDIPDPALPIDCVPNTARPAKVSHAISNSFGFGGQNVCVVLGAEPS
jgi:3-oxoacyl-[acyl-carrier-protein] synthase II